MASSLISRAAVISSLIWASEGLTVLCWGVYLTHAYLWLWGGSLQSEQLFIFKEGGFFYVNLDYDGGRRTYSTETWADLRYWLIVVQCLWQEHPGQRLPAGLTVFFFEKQRLAWLFWFKPTTQGSYKTLSSRRCLHQRNTLEGNHQNESKSCFNERKIKAEPE